MSAALGPFVTSDEALLAMRPGDGSRIGRESRFALLQGNLDEAGVKLGEWDMVVLHWLAGLDVQTVAVIAGWVGRARRDSGSGDDTRRLGGIRDLLARFDWEHDDRQYALEAIERIANEGGLPVEVDTGQVRALNDAIEGIAAAVARLTEMVNLECDLRDAWYQKGRYDERAAILGGSEGCSGRSGRLRGGGPRPGHLQPVRSKP